MRSTIRSTALAGILMLAAATAAPAQPPAHDGARGPRPMAAQMQAMHEAHARQRAQDLRTVLRLRPDQEPALTAFLASHRPPMPPGDRRGPPPEALTTPQRLDEMARREAAHAAMGRRRAEALRTFYAALSPEQRQVFDALQRMEGGGHGHGGWGHRGFGGPMGGHGGGPPPGGPPSRG
jgi:Spy/CpxP family protein refolding chaperone